MNNRFIIQQSELKQNHWVCTDTENLLVCTFENKNYNDNQKFEYLKDDVPDATTLARFANEMAAWLRENHYNKVL